MGFQSNRVCSICGRSFEDCDGCVYWDEEHGISNAKICKTCFAIHILKYYPDGRVAEHIRNNPGEYVIHPAERKAQAQPALFELEAATDQVLDGQARGRENLGRELAVALADVATSIETVINQE